MDQIINRQKITAINHYDVFPFDHGGAMAVRGFEKALSKWFDISIITFVIRDVYDEKIQIGDHITIYPIYPSEKLIKKNQDVFTEFGMTPENFLDTAPAVLRYYHLDDDLIERVRTIAKDSILLISEHVYSWKVAKTACPDKQIWYRAHNVEYDYERKTFEVLTPPKSYFDELYDFEEECCKNSERILTVSGDERKRFIELYGIPYDSQAKFIDIHLGCDIDKSVFSIPSKRHKISNEYDYCGFFISSAMPSGLEAARVCIEVARNSPNIRIVIAGRVSNLLRNEKNIPDNVDIVGLISEEDKTFYLSNCDFALNPVESGAGVNMKMFEFFAYGIPVISTHHGVRGINAKNGVDVLLTKAVDCSFTVNRFCEMTDEEKDELAMNAFRLLENEYSWNSIAERTASEFSKLYNIDYKQSEVDENETSLYDFSPKPSFIPRKAFYIRCAGKIGRKCLNYLRKKGKEPIAFVENNMDIVGSVIDNLKVISVGEYLLKAEGTDIVVAVVEWPPVVADLLFHGVSEDRIMIAWGENGNNIFRFSDLNGSKYPYIDTEKMKEKTLRISEELKMSK